MFGKVPTLTTEAAPSDTGGGEQNNTLPPPDNSNTVTPDSSGAITGDAPPLIDLNTEGAPVPDVTSTGAATTVVAGGTAVLTSGELKLFHRPLLLRCLHMLKLL